MDRRRRRRREAQGWIRDGAHAARQPTHRRTLWWAARTLVVLVVPAGMVLRRLARRYGPWCFGGRGDGAGGPRPEDDRRDRSGTYAGNVRAAADRRARRCRRDGTRVRALPPDQS